MNTDRNEQVAILMRSSGRATLLSRALRSVVSQTTSNWTLHLLFDRLPGREGSTILEYYQSVMGPRLITLINNRSGSIKGLEASLAGLLDSAKYAFASVHNETDTWDPEFLQRSVERFNREPQLAAVASRFKYVYESVHHNGLFHAQGPDPSPVKETVLNALNTDIEQDQPPLAFVVRLPYLRSCGHYSDLLSLYGQLEWQRHLVTLGDVLIQGGPVLATKHQTVTDSEVSVEVPAAIPADTEHLAVLKPEPEPEVPLESEPELVVPEWRPRFWFNRLFNKEKS